MKVLIGLTCVLFVCVNCFNLENREPIIKRGNPGSYFGYSVAQHKIIYKKSNATYNWLLVGAPLGQNLQPETTKSGALFKCPITNKNNDCTHVATDGRRSEDDKKLYPPRNDEIKDGQWMGVTVKSQGPEGMVLVCAHRYVTVVRESRCGQGLCYILTNDLEYENAYEPCKGRSIKREHQDYGLCQTGTSGALLPDGNAIFGAPGPYTWRGTLFVQAVDGDFLNRDKTVYMGPLNDTPDPVDKYSYLGMSVTAGNYQGKEMLFAAGAPRANETGQVVIFSKKHANSVMRVVLKLNGEQFASSFGYEMASADVNGDGIADLLVGAPFYFSREEGGAVYVYTNLLPTNSGHWQLKLTGRHLESRFGFAISSAGDLNRDGFEDIAIGAPYEDDGAVYIYLGSKNGLISEASQKILPLKTKVTTLGYSLSGGQDMDENGYPDLLVGAYESDVVLLYRGRVIIDINTNITDNELKNIDPSKQKCLIDPKSNTTCFTFKACCTLKLQTKGNLQSTQTLIYVIEAETFANEKKYSRVFFKTDGDKRINSIKRKFLIQPGKYSYCQDETVYLKENTRDILSPIKFRLNFTLGDDKANSAILNKQKSETIFKATFQKDCGDNDICESNLIIDAKLKLQEEAKNEYILTLGEENELKVDITVTNIGEPAYETELFVEHHSSLSYIAIGEKTGNIICNYRNETLVVCNLGNPFKKDRVNVFLRFEPKNLGKTQKKLHFNIFVNSTSKEMSKKTSTHLVAHVVKRAEVAINGATTSHVFYGGEVKGESLMKYFDDIGSRVVHTYQVVNSGPWKIEYLEVHIEWPFQVANNKPLGKWLLYLEERPIIEGGEYCQTPIDAVNPLDLFVRPGTQEIPVDNEIISSYQDSSYNSTTRTKRDIEMIIKSETFVDNDGHRREIVNMNCQNTTAKCAKFHCVIKNLERSSEATIKIRSRLWNSTLVEDYPRIDWIRIVSNAYIVIPDDYSVEQNVTNDFAMVETLAYPDLKDQQEAEPAPLWIIIVAVVAGLLLLILLTLLLWKLGFFKRQRLDPTLSGNLEKHSREGEPFLNS